MMRVPVGRLAKWLGVALAVAAVTALAVRAWVVPSLIVGVIQSKVGGKVEIRGWWLNARSAGVVGLRVHEGPGVRSPVWASAGRVTTDLTLAGLLRGRTSPRRVRIQAPEVVLRLDRQGRLLTRVGARGGGSSSGPLPVVIADGARVTLQQEGRPAMVVTGVTARLGPDGDLTSLAARTNDPEWGPTQVLGRLGPGFSTGRIDLKSLRSLAVTPAKTASIPFVPAEVWTHVAPHGRVDVALTAEVGDPLRVRTELTLRGATVRSDALGLTATRTTGRVVVDGGLVRLEGVKGEAIGGRVTADGALDFTKAPPEFDLDLDLDHVDIADAPPSWQLDETGVTGRLSGKVHVVALLKPDGVDLAGTTGEAVVTGATVQGLPVKSLTLAMRGRGNDLRYETPKTRSSSLPALTAALVALQAPPDPKAEEPRKPVIRLPKSLSTHLELEDVELSQLVARAEFLLGFPFPLPVTGRLSLKADATLPLGGGLKDLKGYAFHGDLTLTRASIYQVDLGRVSARVDLEDGLLELKDLRGRLLDRPDGGPDNPPGAASDEVPATGPLPPGAFRGTLRAPLSPPGKLTARFEGEDLPLGELAAPALPRPTPLSGLATLTVDASADLTAATDPAAWSASGAARSQRIHYRGATLDAVGVSFDLHQGRLDVSELTALLRNKPLSAKVSLGLKPPQSFQGSLNVTGWDLSEILAWLPGVPRPAPVAGAVSARAEARGTLSPLALTTDGQGRFDRLRAGPVTLGEVPFGWTTRGDVIALSVTDARPFGGRVTAEASVPLTPGKPIEGEATVTAIDTAQLSASIPGGGLRLTGRASGRVTFSVPRDASRLDAAVGLAAPDLTVQGVPVEQARATVRAHKGVLGYEVTAESLGGRIKLKGDFPLAAGPVPGEADGELQAVGFTLDRLWLALGMTGLVTRVHGLGAVDANLRALRGGKSPGLYAHGIAEVRGLRWGQAVPLGRLRGVVAVTPTSWRVDDVRGEVFDGVAGGSVWGTSPADPGRGKRQLGFDLRLERMALKSALAPLPVARRGVEGFGTLRLAGTLGDALRATGDFRVPHATIAGLPVTDLRAPAEVASAEGSAASVLHVRRWSARVAGGQVRGDAWFRLGEDRSFQSDLALTDVDLESIARVETEARRPASGKISGRVTLSGPDLTLPRQYRGKVVLDLDDASLVGLPVFREIDRFLGSARGGLFEDGDLTGTVANRQLVVEMLTLQGRLAQVHATGTVGFDGELNLEVLVNTNQIIPQTGQALVGVIPGLGNAVNRDREATLQVANFLSNRLLKLRVTGTVRNPSVGLDPGIGVGGTAVGFFAGVLKLPLGLIK